jgi:aldehyde:ferredoxin oxidoreductase
MSKEVLMALNRKIAFIDLDNKQIETTPVPDEWREKFLGGRGLGAYLSLMNTPVGCDPLGPGSTMVISAGLLGGTPGVPAATTCITAKSPLTGLFGCAFLPGLFASEMRWAGFDHLVIFGRTRQPGYLFLSNGRIEIIDSSKTRGSGVLKTCERVRRELGDEDLKILAIGPAGENRVRFATIADDAGHTTGRTGMGAVLGSMNIKALACRGTLDIEIKSPAEVIRYHHAQSPAEDAVVEKQPAGVYKEADAVSLQDCRGPAEDFRIPAEINRAVADFGMDSQVFMLMAGWGAGCYDLGLITGKVAAQFGSPDKPFATLPELAEQIALRKGFGDTLAEGPLRASIKVGSNSLENFGSVKDLISLHAETTREIAAWPRVPTFTARKGSTAVYRGKPGAVAHRDLSAILLDILGSRHCADICPRTGRLDAGRVADLIRLNTGLELNPKELHKIAYRCYAVERLYNLREKSACRKGGQPDTCLDVPGGIKLSPTVWSDIDLKRFRRLTAEFYRQNGWDRKTAVKKKVLDHLGVGELWDTIK